MLGLSSMFGCICRQADSSIGRVGVAISWAFVVTFFRRFGRLVDLVGS